MIQNRYGTSDGDTDSTQGEYENLPAFFILIDLKNIYMTCLAWCVNYCLHCTDILVNYLTPVFYLDLSPDTNKGSRTLSMAKCL